MNRRLNLTSLPDELLMKIMQGGPTTCDGIPNVQVKLTPEVQESERDRWLIIDIEIEIERNNVVWDDTQIRSNGLIVQTSSMLNRLVKLKHEINRDLIQAIKRDVSKWWSGGVHNSKVMGFRVMVELGQVPDAKLEAVATQAGTRFLEFIATTLKKIGKKYGLHVRDGRVKSKVATFYLCEGGKLAQASRAFHGLKS